MNVVSFYAPRQPKTVADIKRQYDYVPLLNLLEASCRRYGVHHYCITDQDDIPGARFDTFRCKLPEPLMLAILKGQYDFLRNPSLAMDDTILLGADCVLGNTAPWEAFNDKSYFDIMVTINHQFMDCPLNTGAIYVRGCVDASPIWRAAMESAGTTWGDDQLALAAQFAPIPSPETYAVRKAKNGKSFNIRFATTRIWNDAPDSLIDDISNSCVLHFRGPRKRWELDYCKKYLSLVPV